MNIIRVVGANGGAGTASVERTPLYGKMVEIDRGIPVFIWSRA